MAKRQIFTANPQSPSGIAPAVTLRATPRNSSTSGDGIGVSETWEFPGDTGIYVSGGKISLISTDVSAGTEDAYFELRTMQAGSLGHADLRTKDTDLTGTKVMRLNNRNYVNTSGDTIAVESKPRRTASNSGGELRAYHAMPNLSDALNSGPIQGFFSECYMRGTGAGTVNLVRAFYGKVLDDSDSSGSGTKTYTNPVAILWAEANIGAGNTFSAGLHVINVVKGVYKDWDSLVRFSASGGACTVSAGGMFKDPLNDQEAGYVTIYVGSTSYQIPIYATS